MSGRLDVLGAYGGRFRHKNTSSFALNEAILIDAGNIVGSLGKEAKKVKHIFLTHAHLDHILDIPFLADTLYSEIDESINVYALPESIRSLQDHVMNEELWPDFSRLHLPNSDQPCIRYVPIEWGQSYEIEGHRITPVPTDHTVATCGYVVEYAGSAVYISGDTGLCDALWETVNQNKKITAMLLEVSFPSSLKRIAEVSKHLTPQMVREVVEKIERDDLTLYFYHMKPFYRDAIKLELDELLDGQIAYTILDDDEVVEYLRN